MNDNINLEKEYQELDDALSYWGDKKLHKILKRWFENLKRKERSKDATKKC
jgi:hypothetical protein